MFLHIFLVSYNEELSAFSGSILEDQSEFAAISVSKILSLYKSNKYTKTIPTSVIIIGHSMVRAYIIVCWVLCQPHRVGIQGIKTLICGLNFYNQLA